MALTRRFLTALGIEQDKIDEIINAHSETVDGLKEQISSLKESSDKLPSVEKELEELKATLEKNDGKDTYQVKYDELKAEFDKYKADVELKESKMAKESAYRKLLKDAGVSDKRFDSVVKVTDLDAYELDENGNIKDADKVLESIKTDWSDFIPTVRTEGASITTPPTNNGGVTKTKEEIMAIKDGVERRREMAKNPQLFGIAPQQTN